MLWKKKSSVWSGGGDGGGGHHRIKCMTIKIETDFIINGESPSRISVYG